ncbi:siphovirus Gp157 family protein [Lactobacillus sp. UCMA15818]|uniref:siphovirus Gp157 family protein n=1 Tax=Lactobacillus sp. UCMA15818 TaxID=2583394 RepID=UPI0025AF9D2E|nr:siphovirus Gp157 family protein [Lactobacillus sp. UCMA15818]MDN2452550.1 siphovirus Gp157 family protein [Lactobacillus sp. UCMA15818]
MNLFELTDKYKELANRDDLDPEMIKDTLDSIEDTFNSKVDNIATWIERNQMNIDWLTKKIQELRELQTTLKNKNKQLNQYLTEAIDNAGYKEVKTDNHFLKPRNYRPSVIVSNESAVPDSYKNVEQVTKIDKKLLYEDLKNGKDINGVELKPSRKVVIK